MLYLLYFSKAVLWVLKNKGQKLAYYVTKNIFFSTKNSLNKLEICFSIIADGLDEEKRHHTND